LGGEADRINEAKLIDGVAARGKKVLDQGCQMARVFSNQKISIWENILRALQWKMFVYLINTWYIFTAI
jgi:hypothetical protein